MRTGPWCPAVSPLHISFLLSIRPSRQDLLTARSWSSSGPPQPCSQGQKTNKHSRCSSYVISNNAHTTAPFAAFFQGLYRCHQWDHHLWPDQHHGGAPRPSCLVRQRLIHHRWLHQPSPQQPGQRNLVSRATLRRRRSFSSINCMTLPQTSTVLVTASTWNHH